MWGYEQIAEHHAMVADRVRTEAFRRAIHVAVRPGDVVCDLGCGTGILSLFACEAGAARVYAIERTRGADLAREVVARNGLAARITVLHGEVRGIRLPERVDVLVSEWIGHAGIEENMLPAVVDARRRFLKPGGRLVPERVSIFAAPVEDQASFAYVGYFASPVYGFDFGAVAERAASQTGLARLEPRHVLAEPARQATLDAADVSGAAMHASSEFVLRRDGLLHGVALWFECDVAGDVTLSSAPGAPRTHWQQLVLPIAASPVAVRRGDLLRLELESRPAGQTMLWAWRGAVHGADGAEHARFARRSARH